MRNLSTIFGKLIYTMSKPARDKYEHYYDCIVKGYEKQNENRNLKPKVKAFFVMPLT